MVARKGESYKEARNMDNFTACVNINISPPCVLCYNKDVNGFPTFQHPLKRSLREGESLFWKVPFDNIAYFQIGESNDKPYEPAIVCQETDIC